MEQRLNRIYKSSFLIVKLIDGQREGNLQKPLDYDRCSDEFLLQVVQKNFVFH